MSVKSRLLRLGERMRSRTPTPSRPAADVTAGDGGSRRAVGGASRWPASWLRRPAAHERARWARRALDWPLVNYLEGAVWLGVALTLGVSYYGSYDNLVDVLMALGYAIGPAHVVPIAVDAPLTVSVIGQFLLARWKSSAWRRWRLFAVTLITAPLSLAGNALHGALRFDGDGRAQLDLSLLDLQHPEVVIRLVAAMVPAIGVILAVAVTELVLREHARLEELREAGRDLPRATGRDEAPGNEQANAPAPAGGAGELAGGADSGGIAPHRRGERSEPGPGSVKASRRPAAEVLAMVRSARERLASELEREPKDEEVASRVSADGHPITASRVRTYLAQLRAEAREGGGSAAEPVTEEVVAWRGR